MYRRDPSVPGGWPLQQQLIASNASVNGWGSDGFGASIYISGERMVVGAPYARTGPASTPYIGQAYVFEEAGGTWTETRRLSSQRIELEAQQMGSSAFGDAVSFSHGVIAVGDWADIQANQLSGGGRVYLYEDPLGTPHCPGSGAAPELLVSGTAFAQHGGLTVTVRQLGGASACLLAASNVGAATPVGPGPGGLPCLAGTTRRLGVTVAAPGSGGLQSFAIGVDVPQLGFLIGETWAFQAWSRTAGGTATSNAVAVTFE
jgi:hypothetical protein